MATTKARITIKDVANRANVTAQTVSRVIRGHNHVSVETRNKVLEAIKELNYIPSYAGKALRSGMAKSIALVFDSLRNYYFAIMIDYLREEITKRGYSIQLLFSDQHVITNSTYRKAISHGAVAVISFLEGEQELGSVICDNDVPLIILGRSTHDGGLDYITTDDVSGGKLAARKLIEAGCERFVYVKLRGDMSCVLERGRGFAEGLNEYGLINTEFDFNEDNEEQLSQEIDLTDPKLGIFCFNDIIAFKTLKQMNYNDKEHCAKLVGYDNIQSDIVLPVNITTIGPDKQSLAAFTIDKLEQRLRDGVRIVEYQPVIIFEGATT